MNRADIPALCAAIPAAAIELWYRHKGVSFEKRNPRMQKATAWLVMAVFLIVLLRFFTDWGVVHF